MRKVNNKGFAITGILYSILILFMLVIVSFLTALSNKKDYLYNLTNSIQNELDMNKTHNINHLLQTESETGITGKGFYITDYRGKYAISNNSCTSYFYLPMETKIEKVNNDRIRFNGTTEIDLCSCQNASNSYSCASTTSLEKSDNLSVVKVYTSYDEVDRVIPRLDLPESISVLDNIILSERTIFGPKGGTTSCNLVSYTLDDPEDDSPIIGPIDALDNLSNGIYRISCAIEANNGIVLTGVEKTFRMIEPVIDPTIYEEVNRSYYTYEAPISGYYQLEAWGAQGGAYYGTGGKGGYSTGIIYLEEGEKLYAYVGGQGTYTTSTSYNSQTGGYNGGGNAVNYAGGGGGASDIRLIAGDWNNTESLNSRILVAAGGGGGQGYSSYSYIGGFGGGQDGSLNTGNYVNINYYATQTSGGTAYSTSYNTTSGTFGTGGNGGFDSTSYGGAGGGGGGWYGGAGGYYRYTTGAGGSSFTYNEGSYISVLSTSVLKQNDYKKYFMFNTRTLAGNVLVPTVDENSTMTGKENDGAIKITFYKRKVVNQINEEYSVANDTYNPYYTYIVKKDGYYKLETWGAQGGAYYGTGGKGGYTTGTVYLSKGTKLYIYVGGQGTYTTGTAYVANGYNGGGYNGGGNATNYAGTGGGATDIRLTSGLWNDTTSLNSRLIVAGGGGGGQGYSSYSYTGGYGGGETGGLNTGNYVNINYYATQTSGGTAYSTSYNTTSGTFGTGGNGGFNSTSYGGAGGGGGGWYGGAGGYYRYTTGAGGSGFAWTEVTSNFVPIGYSVSTSYYLRDQKLIAGNTSMPTHDGSATMIGNEGNGYAKITFASETITDPVDVLYENANTIYNPYYIYTVQTTGYYDLETWGAQGGAYYGTGGKGGYSKGTVYLTKGIKLYIYVGSQGTHTNGSTYMGYGGYNGGGDAVYYAGTGGGASDIRLTAGTWNNTSSLNSRLIVAGGGGGAQGSSSYSYIGGNGGGEIGENNVGSYIPASGMGTQTSGGIAYSTSYNTTSGTFGTGGNGGFNSTSYGGAGGGGGGWYGGAGGYYRYTTGGGGSGFVWSNQYADNKPTTYTVGTSYYAFNPTLISGNETMPTHDGNSTMTGNSGSGAVKITFVGNTEPELETDITYIKANSLSQPYNVYVVSKDGYYDLETWGAQGGSFYGTGGNGGYSKGTFYLTTGTKLYIYVGSQGNHTSGSSGGYNGGGVTYYNASGGGGATDIRLVSGTWNDAASLNSRIIVAGGGGGAQGNSSYTFVGGAGGGEIAQNGVSYSTSYYAYGATLVNGGIAYSTSNNTTSGTFGIGGNGYYNSSNSDYSGGGGGGGWYGGAGGYNRTTGSGGSGFVWSYKNSYAITSSYNVSTSYYAYNAITINGNETIPTIDGSSTMSGKTGNGSAKITYVGTTTPNESDPTTITYTIKNDAVRNYYTYFVTKAGYYNLEVWGASGGQYYGTGGSGGYTAGTVYLSKGTKLYIYVGGQGTTSVAGYNGGGSASSSAGRGGGATDIRLISGTWNDTASLNSRIIVAGGGGGTQANSSYLIAGGRGGGIQGGDGTSYSTSAAYYAYGGTQISGGTAYSTSNNTTSGTFGSGGTGYYSSSSTANSGGGGGGGWYGGAGGYSRTTGGGGSGFVYTSSSIVPSTYTVGSVYQMINIVLKSGNQTIPAVDGLSTTKGNIGDGATKITYIGTAQPEIDPNLYQPEIETVTYTSPGLKNYTALENGFYKLEVWGAQGGARYGVGGAGGYSMGVVYLSKNTNIFIHVGGAGTYTTDTTYIDGGYNGGGSAANSAGTGGGATDIRLSSGTWNDAASLKSRIIVAGGGGGGQGNSSYTFVGGAGGGLSGVNATYNNSSYYAYAGSQTSGGSIYSTNYGSTAGTFGAGGTGGFYASSTSYAGGGGGGGWYGGGGGYYNRTTGAGGSGFIFNSASTIPSGYTPSSDYYLQDARIFAGNQSMPTIDGNSTMTGKTGDGAAKITYLGKDY